MVKHEIKIPFHNGEELKTLIQKSYFEEGDRGKLLGRKNFIKINDDVNHAIFKGLNNITVKITNEDVIDGSMRFVVEEKSDEIRLYPISIYAIPDGEKYIFY
jgi:hypothetical protein